MNLQMTWVGAVKRVCDVKTKEHFGHLEVDGTALISGDNLTNMESDVDILNGPNLVDPFDVIPLGPTDAVGTRITVD